MNKDKLISVIKNVSVAMSSVLAFILLDFTQFIKNIFLFTGVEKFIVIMDIVIKFILVILIIIISLYINWGNKSSRRKLYNDSEIIKYVSKYKNLKTITLFGFSLSFAETLRLYLSQHKMGELEVKIFIPTEEFISMRIKEGIPLEARLGQLRGRVHEWETLYDDKMIKHLLIKRFSALPVANGIILNDEKCFMFVYNWELEGDKVYFRKVPRKERLKILIDKKEKRIWRYIVNNIYSYEEMAINDEYCR